MLGIGDKAATVDLLELAPLGKSQFLAESVAVGKNRFGFVAYFERDVVSCKRTRALSSRPGAKGATDIRQIGKGERDVGKHGDSLGWDFLGYRI
jgi:hypothetical protein